MTRPGSAGIGRPEATIYPLNHVLRNYAWGSTTAIPELLARPPATEPVAELWLGAHPDSPALITDASGPEPLDAWLAKHADVALGDRCRAGFGDRLPYLLKVLAADQALSLQVHPTAEQAATGFADEEAAGVPHDARQRRYKDPFHKPELVLALTEFHALCGLRAVAESRDLLDEFAIDHPVLHEVRTVLGGEADSTTLRRAFDVLLGQGAAVSTAVKASAEAARAYVDEQPHGAHAAVARTTVELAEAYPDDAGVLVSLLLNRVTLQPGEALYLPAGNVHAYLRGTAIEVMAASDNVLRAGLTPKFVDVEELLSIVDFQPRPKPYVRPEPDGAAVLRYRPDVAEFALCWVNAADGASGQVDPVIATGDPGPRIVLCVRGAVRVTTQAGSTCELRSGEAAFVPACEPGLQVAGEGSAVVVSVP